MIQVKSLNQIDMHSKEKVFISCHPADHTTFFEPIANEILNCHDCAIYFDSPDEDPLTDGRQQLLREMNLVVILVSRNFLNLECIAYSFDFQFAKENSITLLPIIVEDGIRQQFNNTCGTFHLLDRNNKKYYDKPYTTKLREFLANVFVGTDLAMEIRSAFDAYIFLSYRKEDVINAKKLMRLIHKSDATTGVAIWYDEFLIPGENYSSELLNTIRDSDMFVLAVTPNVLAANNYVINVEYPAALSHNKPIIPIEFEKTDKKQLNKMFPSLPDCIPINREEDIYNSIINAARNNSSKTNMASDKRSYLLGLAYLYGIDVEIDKEKAIALLSSAAESDNLPATYQLRDLFYNGVLVNREINEAQYWQKKAITILRKQKQEAERAPYSDIDLADNLRLMAEMICHSLKQQKEIEKAEELCKEALSLYKLDAKLDDESQEGHRIESFLRTIRQLAISSERYDSDKALYYYYLALEMRNEIAQQDKLLKRVKTDIGNQLMRAQLYQDIGICYRNRAQYPTAFDELKKAEKIYEEVSKALGDDRLMVDCSIYTDLANAAELFDVNRALFYSEKAEKTCERCYDQDSEEYGERYASALLTHAVCITNIDKSPENDALAEELLKRAILIFEDIYPSGVFKTTFNHMLSLYKLANIYMRLNDWHMANLLHFRSAEIANEIEAGVWGNGNEYHNLSEAELITIANVHYDYSVQLLVNRDPEDIDIAVEQIEKAKDLFTSIYANNPTDYNLRNLQDAENVKAMLSLFGFIS